MIRSIISRRILSITLLTAAIFTGSISSVYAASADPKSEGPNDPKEVEAFADRFFVQHKDIPGVAVVIVKDGKVVLQKGYGYADIEKGIPVDPEKTVFRLASVSKSFTAAAVMQLVEQGKIDLKQDVNAYLGNIRLRNRFSEPVTMEHLLTHTTGFDFPDARPGEDLQQDIDNVVPLKDYIAENMPTVVRKPGESYNYDNFASMLQGYIVQNLSGVPFHQYMNDHIFKSLGMNDSSFLLTPVLRSRLATGYGEDGKPLPLYATIPTDMPQGGMLSTASDVSKFMLVLLNRGTYGNTRLLKESTVDNMLSIHFSLNPQVPLMAYGFETLYRGLYNGRYVIGKAGDIDGYSSWMWLMPEENTGGFIVYNSGEKLRKEWFKAFMDRYYPKKAETSAFMPSPLKELKKFEGYYRDLRIKTWITHVVAAADGKLIVEEGLLGKHELEQTDSLLFRDRDGNTLAFQQSADGKIRYLNYLNQASSSQKLNQPKPFADANKAGDYTTHIEYLNMLGIVRGQADGSFGPTEPITRAEFAVQAARLLGVPLTEKSVVFKDVRNNPAAAEIQTLYEMGIVSGMSVNAFTPDKPITREEAAMIVWRMLQLTGTSPIEVKIKGEISPWASEAVRLIVGLGLYGPEVKADADGSVDYKSKQPMLRQEAAALFAKMLRSFVPT